MNIKRGLFRIWIVLSVIFILLLAFLSSEYIGNEFKQAKVIDAIIASAPSAKGVPVKCADARAEGKDWYLKFPDADDDSGLCWYPLNKFRTYYPEYKDLADRPLISDLYEKSDKYIWMPTPWWTVAAAIGWGVGLPLSILAFGSAIYWAFAGFARKPSDAA